MSGYLQRLATSVLQPGASIHPILGSVFSAPAVAAPREHEEIIPQRSAAAEPARSAPAAPRLRSVDADASVPHDAPHPQLPERAGFRAMVDPQEPQDTELPTSPAIETAEHSVFAPRSSPGPIIEPSRPVSRHHPVVTWDSSQPKRKQSAEAAVQASEPSIAATPDVPQRDAETTAYRPLIEKAFRHETPPTILRETFRGGRKTERRDSPHPQAVRPHEPDEIQIHIGRIEVVAAPPSPVRAEPKPVRPSPNLGDYLKRRNGRA